MRIGFIMKKLDNYHSWFPQLPLVLFKAPPPRSSKNLFYKTGFTYLKGEKETKVGHRALTG